MSILMSELTWEEYEERIKDSIIILPVGSTEQHGYHMPLGVDYIQINEVSKLIAEQLNAIVAPAIPYGYKSLPHSGGGNSFPGTTNLNAETLTLLVKDILLEFLRHGAKKIVVMDGHYENGMHLTEAVDLAVKENRTDNKDFKIVKTTFIDLLDDKVVEDIFVDGFPGYDLEHAGLIETSLMLYLRPDLVQLDKMSPDKADNLPPYEIFPEPDNIVPKSGVLSDPMKADSKYGKQIIDNVVKNYVRAFKKEFNV